MSLDGFSRQEESACDLGIALARSDQSRNLPLPLAESVDSIFSSLRLTPAPGPDPKTP